VNLYFVRPNFERYGCFVFAEKPSRAKSLCVYHSCMKDEEYTTLRAELCPCLIVLLNKDVGGEEEVVECPESSGYERVVAAGHRFNDDLDC
jgi:hypothetical protein